MYSRWYSAAVILLWITSMGWLMKEKILPPMLRGEPPSSSRILEAKKNSPAVGWKMLMDNRSIGWALTDCSLQPTQLTEVHGRAHFDELPVEELMHGLLQPLSKLLGQANKSLRLDARSVLIVDPFGQLLRFDSALRFEPCDEIVTVRGTMDRGLLELTLRSGGVSFTSKVPMPPEVLMGDVFSPQTQLPGLRVGQTWTIPICNPLWPSKTPLEIIKATVKGKDRIIWNDLMEETWLVEYRSISENEASGQSAPKGIIWVRLDPEGTVLRQQATLFDSKIIFDRMTEEQTAKLMKKTGSSWWNLETEPRTKKTHVPSGHKPQASDDPRIAVPAGRAYSTALPPLPAKASLNTDQT